MAKNKIKKQIRFLECYKNTVIDKGIKEEIKQTERRYIKHRIKG